MGRFHLCDFIFLPHVPPPSVSSLCPSPLALCWREGVRTLPLKRPERSLSVFILSVSLRGGSPQAVSLGEKLGMRGKLMATAAQPCPWQTQN